MHDDYFHNYSPVYVQENERNRWLKKLIEMFSWLVYFIAFFYVPVKVFFKWIRKVLDSWNRACLFEKRLMKDKLEFRFRKYLW